MCMFSNHLILRYINIIVRIIKDLSAGLQNQFYYISNVLFCPVTREKNFLLLCDCDQLYVCVFVSFIIINNRKKKNVCVCVCVCTCMCNNTYIVLYNIAQLEERQ